MIRLAEKRVPGRLDAGEDANGDQAEISDGDQGKGGDIETRKHGGFLSVAPSGRGVDKAKIIPLQKNIIGLTGPCSLRKMHR